MKRSNRKRVPPARESAAPAIVAKAPALDQRHRLAWMAVALLAGIASVALGTLTPPFQSPDEYAHVKMAHLLSRGQFKSMPAPDGSSGGPMDPSLVRYLKLHNEDQIPRPSPVDAATRAKAESLRWSGVREYSPGGVIYLPLPYIPQAVGLRLGEAIGLTVGNSYRLARIAAGGLATLLLVLAFWLYRPAPLAAAIVVLPMTLFQMSSASIDGVTVAMCVVTVSAFLRLWRDGETASTYVFAMMLLMLVMTVPARPYLLPMFVLPLMSAWKRRRLSWAVWTAVAAAIPVMWILPMFYPSDTPLPTPARAPLWEIIRYYIDNPSRIPAVVMATARHAPTTTLYFESFIGLLGWLDTRFARSEYDLLFAILLLTLALTVAPRSIAKMPLASVTLATCGIVALALVFVALWLFWSPHPAVLIRGVQGRYFAIPLILVAYALCPNQEARLPAIRWVGFALVALLLLMSTLMTADLLQRRHASYFGTALLPQPTGQHAAM